MAALSTLTHQSRSSATWHCTYTLLNIWRNRATSSKRVAICGGRIQSSVDSCNMNSTHLKMARMATRAELDELARAGYVVVPGGEGGHTLEAQEHLAEGRSKGGHTRADQLGHEGFVEMGRKGGLASHGADPYQLAAHLGRDIDEKKFMCPEAIAELERRAAAGETVVPGGTGGHTLEAQKHLAQGRHKGGHTRASQLGHPEYLHLGKKDGEA